MKMPFTVRVERKNYDTMKKRASKYGWKSNHVVDNFLVWFSTTSESEIFEFMKNKHLLWIALSLIGLGLWFGVGEEAVKWVSPSLEQIDKVLP